LVLFSTHAGAQSVVIRHGTPGAVVEVLKKDLLPQGFKFASGDEKAALFTLDRGVVIQERGAGTAHVILELRVRFKPQVQDLEVTATEEVLDVLLRSRRAVRSQAELNNLQRLLDSIRIDLESRPASSDSAVRRDSSGL
jgi:hypothetical protein